MEEIFSDDEIPLAEISVDVVIPLPELLLESNIDSLVTAMLDESVSMASGERLQTLGYLQPRRDTADNLPLMVGSSEMAYSRYASLISLYELE